MSLPSGRQHNDVTWKQKHASSAPGQALAIAKGATHVFFARVRPLTLPVKAKSAQLPENTEALLTACAYASFHTRNEPFSSHQRYNIHVGRPRS